MIYIPLYIYLSRPGGPKKIVDIILIHYNFLARSETRFMKYNPSIHLFLRKLILVTGVPHTDINDGGGELDVDSPEGGQPG